MEYASVHKNVHNSLCNKYQEMLVLVALICVLTSATNESCCDIR